MVMRAFNPDESERLLDVENPLRQGHTQDSLKRSYSSDSDRSDSPIDDVYSTLDKAVQERQKQRTFHCFLVMYLMYVSPCLYALVNELLTYGVISPDVIPMAPSCVGLGGFVGTVLCLYGALRVAVGKLGWKQNPKTAAQHKEDLLRLGTLSTALGVLGRVANRVHAPDGPLFVALLAYYTAFFTVIFEGTKHLNIVLTKDCVRNPFTVMVVAVTSTCTTGVLALHIAFAAADKELAEFLGFLLAALVFHAVLLAGPGHAHVHVHHWYWAFAVAHICVFDSRTSQLAQAMFCGCYIHGVALFGVEKCFYNSAEEDANTPVTVLLPTPKEAPPQTTTDSTALQTTQLPAAFQC